MIMIDVKELRIGNYIKDDFGYIIQVSSIEKIGIDKWNVYSGIITNADCKLDNLSGIKITTDILFKCGFVDKQSNLVLNAGQFIFFVFPDSKGISISFTYLMSPIEYTLMRENERYTSIDHIIYLHQLQNLYYSLMNEELEINWGETKKI